MKTQVSTNTHFSSCGTDKTMWVVAILNKNGAYNGSGIRLTGLQKDGRQIYYNIKKCLNKDM